MLKDLRWDLDQAGRDLLDVAAIIRERGHCKGALEKNGRVCFVGALNVAIGGSVVVSMFEDVEQAKRRQRAYNQMRRFLGGADPVLWNNVPERTAEQVITAAEKAAWEMTYADA